MRYDVIVVGAGPAGSTAARECASRGLSVVLIDKAAFPRDKPCGGGVNARAARLLPFGLGSIAERTIYGMYISVRQSHGFTRYAPEPLSYLTQRRRLDTFLLEQAERAGAVIRQRMAVQGVDRNGQVSVRAGGESFRGRTLVVADGANGTTARLAGLRVPRLTAIALEANITPPGDDMGPWSDRFAIDVGGVPGGYGWLFPKGDHVNIGVGGWHRVGPTLRTELEALTRFYGFDPGTSWGLRGHPLPVARPGARLVHGNVVLVGDAAGLLDPLTGEGIYSAVWSGRAAAIHLASYLGGGSPNLEGYQRDVDRELTPDLRIAAQLRDLFHLSPPAFAALVRRSPRVWQAVYSLLTGDRTYAGMKEKHRFLSPAIDLGTDAVRALAFRWDGHAADDRFPPDRFFRRWAGPAGS